MAPDSADLRPTRRQRMRAATLSDIREVARRQVKTLGAANLSLRATARELGMSAPALYRYYESRDALLNDLMFDCFASLADALEEARDSVDRDDLAARLTAVALAYRTWSLSHPAEFALVFGGPVHSHAVQGSGATGTAEARFAGVFLELVTEAWLKARFPLDEWDKDDPATWQLKQAQAAYGPPGQVLPLGIGALWLQIWCDLHGTISLEVFGHLGRVLPDGGAVFRDQVRKTLTRLHLPTERQTS